MWHCITTYHISICILLNILVYVSSWRIIMFWISYSNPSMCPVLCRNRSCFDHFLFLEHSHVWQLQLNDKYAVWI